MRSMNKRLVISGLIYAEAKLQFQLAYYMIHVLSNIFNSPTIKEVAAKYAL